ncbi:hypothetical protein [Streptomyces sp. NPDC093109]|uniref:hypothetical protein n=1 Tax=Streptomyces sp. NPDC093109 TaxID=3154977 RepID=UPI003450F15C
MQDPDSVGVRLLGPVGTDAELLVVLFRGGWADVDYLIDLDLDDAGPLPAFGIRSVGDFADRIDGWVLRVFRVSLAPVPGSAGLPGPPGPR